MSYIVHHTAKRWGEKMRLTRRLGVIVLVAVLMVGCVPESWRRYPTSVDRTFSLFGIYEVDCTAYERLEGQLGVQCKIYFLTAVPVGSNCDSLPILIMDKLQISDGCLTEPISFSMTALLSQDWYLANSRDSCLVENYEDLWKSGGVILPSGYYCAEHPVLPMGCTNSAYTLTLSARLIDRKTHLLIAQESIPIRYIASR